MKINYSQKAWIVNIGRPTHNNLNCLHRLAKLFTPFDFWRFLEWAPCFPLSNFHALRLFTLPWVSSLFSLLSLPHDFFHEGWNSTREVGKRNCNATFCEDIPTKLQLLRRCHLLWRGMVLQRRELLRRADFGDERGCLSERGRDDECPSPYSFSSTTQCINSLLCNKGFFQRRGLGIFVRT